MTAAQRNVLDGFLSKCQDPTEVTEAGRMVRISIIRPWGTVQKVVINPAGGLHWVTPVQPTPIGGR